MVYTWFKIFNITEFNALDLISKTYTFILEGVGQKDVLVTKGVTYGMTYEGVFLSLNMIDRNPFEFEGYAIYVDADQNVYLGIEVQS
jgi:hypothetical protein